MSPRRNYAPKRSRNIWAYLNNQSDDNSSIGRCFWKIKQIYKSWDASMIQELAILLKTARVWGLKSSGRFEPIFENNLQRMLNLIEAKKYKDIKTSMETLHEDLRAIQKQFPYAKNEAY